MNKKIRAIGALCVAAIWLGLAGFAWLKPADVLSEEERRKLAQMPGFSVQALSDGSFREDFEDYSVDQFPLRMPMRTLKAVFHTYVLRHKDNNGIYIADGYADQMEYPLNQTSVDRASRQFNSIYQLYLKDSNCKVYMSVIPDKGYYMAQENGYLSLDYGQLMSTMQQGMPWAEYVDITGELQLSSYYRTDTHWRQEKLLPVAQTLSTAMSVTVPQLSDYKTTGLSQPFYGVHYGHAALPMDPDEIYILENDMLSGCKVYINGAAEATPVYDMTKLSSRDLYEVFLSGRQGLVHIENPNAKTDRELVVFRDSYGSSLIPLLVSDYAVVTLIDNRDIVPQRVGNFVDFTDQDVLFLHSALILNSGDI